MKKRLLASLLSLCLLVGLFPTAALAVEDTADEAAVVCMELEGCIGDAHDEDCPLYVAPNEDESSGEDDPADVPGEPDADPVYDNGDDTTVIDPEQEEPVQGPTPAEQLAELIADLPDPSEIDPLDEEQVEAVYNQISAIYAFAGENGFDDIYDNETVNAVIAATWPAETLEGEEITTQDALQQAINDSTGTKENPTTITISTSITLTSTLVIPNGKHIKIVGSTGNESVLTASGTSVSSFTRCYTGTTDSNEDGTNCQSMIIVGATEGSSDNISASLTIQNVKLDAGQYSEDLNASNLTEQNTLRVVYIYGEDATFTMEEGSVVTGGTSYHRASGIFAQVGAIVINGGEVSNNVTGSNASMNGAVGVEAGTITMSAGEVKNNTTTGVGGGLFGSADSKITITGGKICENTAGAMGGGIASYGEVVISGGEISKNKSTLQGGGVFVTRDAGKLTISGDAKITGNEAGRDGGGVAAIQNAVVVMNGGEISSNKTGTSFTGGGVYIGSVTDSTTSFTMSGGKITGNTAGNGNGNAVAVGVSTNKFVMTGGEISGNLLASGTTSGSTVYFAGTGSTQDSPAVFQMTGGSIQNNTSRGIDHVGYLAIELEGTPVITGNSLGSNTVNIHCRYAIPQTQIRLIGELTSGANIGVYTYTYPSSSSFAQATTQETDTAYYLASAEYFTNDRNTSAVAVGNNTSKYVEFIAGTIKTVTFDANTGESSETSTQKVPSGKETALNANTFTRTGYTFQNWSTQTGGGDATYQNGANITTSDDVTLYAQWKANEYTISYELNGGAAGENAPSTHTYGTATTLVDPTRTDYTFGGWFANSDFSGTKITSLGATDYTDNITLYALWTKTIGENGSYAVDEIPAQTYTGAAITPDVVVRNKTSGAIIASGQYSVEYKDNTDAGTASVTITKDSDTVTVNFTINQDTSPIVEMADKSVTYGTEYAMTATAKTSAGNEITDGTITIKYYTDESCTEGETSTVPTNAGTYYAKATLDGTDNYTEATKIAKIEISNATFSVTATGYSGTYDGQAHSITVAADGASVTYSTDGTNYSETNPTFINAGTYNVYYKATKANHDDVTSSVSVEISKAALTITANNQTIYVGGTLPTAYTYTVSGLVGNDTESVIATQPTMTCSAADANTAGTYTITASGANAGENYTITYVDGTLTIATVETGEAFKVEVNEGFDAVPTGLSSKYNTVGDLTSDLKTKITTANSSVSTSNIVVYDVTLMVNLNDGNGWVNADATHFPANGRLTITLPYPEGTNSNYNFTVVHMFTTSDFGKTPGDTETPTVTKTDSGLQFSVTGLSPISVGWTAPASNTGGGGGGSSSSSYIVTVDSAKNGTVKADRTSASKGTTVTLTVTPKDGYELDGLTVTDKNGDTVKLTRKSDTQYTFTMPASKVTVEASFTEIEEQPAVSFVDVSTSAYYYDAVAWAVENGVTAGTSATTFSPDASCTRAQAVTFLWRAAGSPAPKSSVNPFADVPASAYYYDAVLWAVEQGITAGTSATTFSPDATCTRAQIVTFLYRADGTATTSNNPFVDVADSAYYVDAVKWAVAEGVTAGTSATTFSPDASCTRAQIVTFLYRAYA